MDRSSVNVFDDPRVASAIEATGRRKLIFAGLSLEVCAAFPAITAVSKGLHAYVAVDACGTSSETKRQVGLLRMSQAGVILSDYATLMAEISRGIGVSVVHGLAAGSIRTITDDFYKWKSGRATARKIVGTASAHVSAVGEWCSRPVFMVSSVGEFVSVFCEPSDSKKCPDGTGNGQTPGASGRSAHAAVTIQKAAWASRVGAPALQWKAAREGGLPC